MTSMDSEIQSLEAHRPAITGHCYRMLGSFFDAEDATQEALLRAWKGLEQFDGRASVKNWLNRIATNVVSMRFTAGGGGPTLRVDNSMKNNRFGKVGPVRRVKSLT